MMNRKIFGKLSVLVSLIIFLLAGCRGSAPAVQFFTLHSSKDRTLNANRADTDPTVAIGVGPVALPKILDRPQIVTRSSPHKVEVDEFHRWAGSLEEDFARVLAENIASLLGTDQVAVYPWGSGFKPRYQVVIDVRYFEGRWGQDVLLEAYWKVVEPQSRNVRIAKTSVIHVPLDAKDYEALVASQSQAIATLGDEIVREIRNL